MQKVIHNRLVNSFMVINHRGGSLDRVVVYALDCVPVMSDNFFMACEVLFYISGRVYQVAIKFLLVIRCQSSGVPFSSAMSGGK